MKSHSNLKKIIVLEIQLENKKLDLETATAVLLQFIKDKASLNDTEKQITKRNILFIDISNLEKQIENLQNNKLQYGEFIQERTVRNWLD